MASPRTRRLPLCRSRHCATGNSDALDAMTREQMNLELQQICAQTGKTTVFITHNLVEAVFLADKVIVLQARPGRVIEEVAVNLPRERDVDTMANDEFINICNHLRKQFEEIVSYT